MYLTTNAILRSQGFNSMLKFYLKLWLRWGHEFCTWSSTRPK